MRIVCGLLVPCLAAAVLGAPKAPPKPAAKPASRALGLAPQEFDLAPGESYPIELFVPSPTGKAFRGKLTFAPAEGLSVVPDSRFTGKVPPWGTKTYPKVTAAAGAAGDLPVKVSLEGGPSATLLVRVVEPTIEPVPGIKRLTVKVTNPFRKRLLYGRVLASNPNRFLEDVTTREFKLQPGQTGELVFPLPGAAPVETEAYDFTLAVETYQGYRSRKTYPLMFPAQDPDQR